MTVAKTMKAKNPDKVIERLWEENNRLIMENEKLKGELRSLRWLCGAIKAAFHKHYEYVREQAEEQKEGNNE